MSCGKVFTKPLKALNLQKDSEEPYDACPCCLTEIHLEEEQTVADSEPETIEQEPFEPEETEPEVEEATIVEGPIETPEAPPECLHHLGYMSEKSSKEPIPDECMMCKDIVTCMLKKMKG